MPRVSVSPSLCLAPNVCFHQISPEKMFPFPLPFPLQCWLTRPLSCHVWLSTVTSTLKRWGHGGVIQYFDFKFLLPSLVASLVDLNSRCASHGTRQAVLPIVYHLGTCRLVEEGPIILLLQMNARPLLLGWRFCLRLSRSGPPLLAAASCCWRLLAAARGWWEAAWGAHPGATLLVQLVASCCW